MLSSPMAVSPRETNVGVRKYCWRGLACASLLLTMAVCIAAATPEARFFRIGTAATGGSFFEIGGVGAAPLSGPPGWPGWGHRGARPAPRRGWRGAGGRRAG